MCAHAHTHTHTHAGAPEHTSILTIQNLIYTVEKMSSRERSEMVEDSSKEQKIWQASSFGKRRDYIDK